MKVVIAETYLDILQDKGQNFLSYNVSNFLHKS